ncbi:gamma-glutamyl-gamma-aminobutyrate hydrolase family protein [Rhodococcus koreensis]
MTVVLVIGSAEDHSLPEPMVALAVAAAAKVRTNLEAVGCVVRFVDTARRPLPPLPELLEGVDGVMLLGGGDIDPAMYGLPSDLPHLYGVDREVDEFAIAVVRDAVQLQLPVLAICRGYQVVNVAFGGSLIPDLAGWQLHRGPAADSIFVPEPVTIDENSILGQILGTNEITVQSGHHQAVDRVGDGLRAVAWAEDGIIEAIEAGPGSASWLVGMQWHPEHSDADSHHLDRLFGAFVGQLTTEDPLEFDSEGAFS